MTNRAELSIAAETSSYIGKVSTNLRGWVPRCAQSILGVGLRGLRCEPQHDIEACVMAGSPAVPLLGEPYHQPPMRKGING